MLNGNIRIVYLNLFLKREKEGRKRRESGKKYCKRENEKNGTVLKKEAKYINFKKNKEVKIQDKNRR